MVGRRPRELDLLAGARAGDAEALGALYEEHAEALYRLVFRFTGSAADAEDVVQDVFLGLPEALRSLRGDNLATWLKSVAVRTACTRLRTERARRELPLGGLSGVVGRREPAVVDRVALERAIAALPKELRFVLVLKEIEGFSHGEIAGLLGISRQASAVRLYRARRLLRGLLRGGR